MEIYLIRHTQTTCEKGICYGQADVELAVPFTKTFNVIAKQLPQQAKLYYSPLKRCEQLAKHLEIMIHPISIHAEDCLKEMNFGRWELQKWEEIPRVELDEWGSDFVNVKVPGGESFVELYQRVINFINTELDFKNPSPVVIVTHAGVIRSFLCYFSNLPLKDAFQNKVDFGEVIKFKANKLR